MARKRSPSELDPALAAALRAALGQGAFVPADACRVLRALENYSIADMAEHVGVEEHVIEALESSGGRVDVRAVEKLAAAFDLRVALIRTGPTVSLLNPGLRRAEQAARRKASTPARRGRSASVSTLPGPRHTGPRDTGPLPAGAARRALSQTARTDRLGDICGTCRRGHYRSMARPGTDPEFLRCDHCEAAAPRDPVPGP